MAKITFNVDAYTARLIGRENVAKLNGAILELVKNTYDADASICFLYYDDKHNTLYIGDNGTGMTPDTIITHWMTIGRSDKKKRFVSKTGRIQTGAKGIGRFALDRIADQCTMLTATDSGSVIWTVDWRDFEKEGTITDISADLVETSLSFLDFMQESINDQLKEMVRTKFTNSGTVFKLSLLHDKWGTNRLANIRDELITLMPYELSCMFNLYLFDNYTDIENAAVLRNPDAFSYDYKIDFEVADDGTTQVNIWRNEFDFRDTFENVMHEAGFTPEDRAFFTGAPIKYVSTFSEVLVKDKDRIANTLGSFHGTLYFAKLTESAKDIKRFYYKDIVARGNFTKTFGGIKIYRDQFRVRPYGDPDSSNYDWLQLSSRKNSSPAGVANPNQAWRVRDDQILGSVFISRVNTELSDQANREGIVETPEFGFLKDFLLNVIQLFERDRQYVCRKLDQLYENKTEAERFRKEIEEKAQLKTEHGIKRPKDAAQAGNPNFTMIDADKAQIVIEAKETEIRNLEDENRLLRILATTGIATNSYIHEFREQTHRLNMKIIMAKEALEFDSDQAEALRQLIIADQIRNSFTSWFRVTVESVRRDKRSLQCIDLNVFIAQLCYAWEQVFSVKGISVRLDLPDDPVFFRCFPYEIEIILSNLITNSAVILNETKGDNKMIFVGLQDRTYSVLLKYSDNGPGLASVYKDNPELILEPFESNKMNDQGELIGTGMGMWLVKRTVSEYNGSINLSQNIVSPTGFLCEIELPK